jgi:phage terminase small subunit
MTQPTSRKAPANSAPQHLRPATQRWFNAVCEEYPLEQHHRMMLQAAAEAWDRAQAAREAIEQHGPVFTDRFGQPQARPELRIERDATISFRQMLRALDLNVETPPTGPLRANSRGLKHYAGH